ncbi:hypothetical protein OIDMADRAFT_35134 [Oidiodendron maius Zn]|uniref:Uncharacterized protein n=1 Tax=Oidiodendron maius (strain Zn) TaxID=913774 RepID=A0A0C3CWL2_OIDMZ|nr:hypothetical protein OIDMADRAFT_35134 [Oidiodendron maius Zn]
METPVIDVSIEETANKILEIILDYALNKFDDTKDQLNAGRPKFLSVIGEFILAGTRVEMCLPAFPFKSANKVYKVFGILPDKAEEIALDRLNTMCLRIGEIYQPGAKCTIISDGLVYNDLLCISDRDTWAYGQALREMAVEKRFSHIGFSRLKDFVNLPLPEKLDEITYVANATNFRRCMMNNFGKEDLDIENEIANSPDTKLTYLGYRRFLESDLRYIFPLGTGRSSHSYKKDVRYLAQQMLIRGHAFARAVKYAFPNHLRLSIHKSTNGHKISMSLLNTKTGFTTPWHCSVALMADGEWLSAPMGDFQKDPRFEIVYEHGRCSYFKEVVDQTVDGEIPVERATGVSEKQKKTRGRHEVPPLVSSSMLSPDSSDFTIKSWFPTATSYSTYLALYIEPFGSYIVADSLRSIAGYFLFYRGHDMRMTLEGSGAYYTSWWGDFSTFWAYVIFNIGAAAALYWLTRVLVGKRGGKVKMVKTASKGEIGIRPAN